MTARRVWVVARLVAAAAITVGLSDAFQASDDLGAAAAVFALGLGLLTMRVDRRIVNRRRSEPN